jgi:hypothetical protein
MPSTETKASTSRVLLLKGKLIFPPFLVHLANDYSFGWVNASYVYGLQHVDAHCQRALGTLSTWEQLYKQRATLYEKDEK